MQQSTTLSLTDAYEKVDNNLRIRYLKIACILGLVLIPGGCPLDYMIYKPFFLDHL